MRMTMTMMVVVVLMMVMTTLKPSIAIWAGSTSLKVLKTSWFGYSPHGSIMAWVGAKLGPRIWGFLRVTATNHHRCFHDRPSYSARICKLKAQKKCRVMKNRASYTLEIFKIFFIFLSFWLSLHSSFLTFILSSSFFSFQVSFFYHFFITF